MKQQTKKLNEFIEDWSFRASVIAITFSVIAVIITIIYLLVLLVKGAMQ